MTKVRKGQAPEKLSRVEFRSRFEQSFRDPAFPKEGDALSRIGAVRTVMHKCVNAMATALAACGIAGNAAAITCYVIYDRAGAVTYRSAAPPVDLSDGGAAARVAMRERGEHLIIADFDQCLPLGPLSQASGAPAASVEDIVSGMRPYGVSGGRITGSARNGPSAPGSGAPPASARPRASGGSGTAYK